MTDHLLLEATLKRDPFETWRKRNATLGQQRLADAIRHLIYQKDEALFDRLEFSDDAQFLHPLLFAFFTDPTPPIDLPQILYGLTPSSRRTPTVQLRTDASGRANLSPLGDIESKCRYQTLDFGRDRNDSPYGCFARTKPVQFRFRSALIIPGTAIEATTDIHPLFFKHFAQPDAPLTDDARLRAPRECLSHLLVALTLIRLHCPSTWAEIASFIRMIVLYRAGSPNSFAAKSAHGAIFCNFADGDDEIALLEDVAHQTAHVIFNAFSHEPMRLIAIDPDTPLHVLCGDPGDPRTLNAAFHAQFTYSLICRVLTTVYDAEVLPERQSHELLGRLGLILKKFEFDLNRLELPAAYTPAGLRCRAAFIAEYQYFRARFRALVDGFAYDNQPYAFDYACFVERNGGPWPVWSKRAF
jgi:hypothetical protein